MAAPDLELSTMAVVLLFIATLILLCAIACLVQCGRVKRAGGAASTKCAAAGAGTRTPMAPVSDEGYPFYAMTVKEILSLTDWHPHQHLLADGKLINLTADPAAGKGREVIFISHQWTGFNHPDPACSQLQALQRVLRSLMDGALDVRTNKELEAIYGIKIITPGTEWKAMLADALIWIDYACMPQPSVEDDLADQASDGAQVQDHRLLENASEAKQRVIEQLTAAVDSIPSYVERCTQMWVLVPATEHQDMADTTCDLYSWRSRGWCRMEFAASKLARGDDMPIVVIESGSTLYYLNPCDTVRLCPAQGDFTMSDDVTKVNSVLGKMHDAKVRDYVEQGDYDLARGLMIFRPNFAPVESTMEQEQGDVDTDPLASLKNRLRWRDETTEKKWMDETGWSLIALAAGLDDISSLKYLLAQLQPGESAEVLKKAVKPFKKKSSRLREQPFGEHIGTSFDDVTPLVLASTWGSPEAVQLLLDAGAATSMEAACGHLPCHCTGAVMGGKLDNLEVLIKHDPTLATKCGHNAMNALHFTCERSGPKTKQMIKLLLDSGADKSSVNARTEFGETPLYSLCRKAEVLSKDPEVLEVLTEAGASLDTGLGSTSG
jgi:hypothetical protein